MAHLEKAKAAAASPKGQELLNMAKSKVPAALPKPKQQDAPAPPAPLNPEPARNPDATNDVDRWGCW